MNYYSLCLHSLVACDTVHLNTVSPNRSQFLMNFLQTFEHFLQLLNSTHTNHQLVVLIFANVIFIRDFQKVSRKAAAAKKGQAAKEPGKAQLWDGIVSIILVEGKKMIPMDDSGLWDWNVLGFFEIAASVGK